MRFTYLLFAALVLMCATAINSGRGEHSIARCHSSFFLPLDPITTVDLFARAVRSNPLSSEAHRALGCAYLSLFDRSQEAQAEFREAIRLDPSDSAAYTGLGWCYLRLNSVAMSVRSNMQMRDSNARPLVAVDFFEHSLALDSNDASAHMGRAQAYFILGRNQDAEAACRAALTSCPNSSEALELLGDVLLRLERYNEAIDVYDAEIEMSTAGTTLRSLSPLKNRARVDLGSVYELVGDILLTVGRSREAIARYQGASAVSGDSSLLHHRLALAYYQTGEYEKYDSHLQALRGGCLGKDDDGGSCHFYDDVVYRLSQYGSNEDMLFHVTNLDPIPTMR